MRLLYIPIISSRSYVDGKFDVKSDGNFQQFLSFVGERHPDIVDVILPDDDQLRQSSLSYIEEIRKDLFKEGIELNWIRYPFCHNAYDQRLDTTIYKQADVLNREYEYDEIISVPTLCTLMLGENCRRQIKKLTYYIPVSGVEWLDFDQIARSKATELVDEIVVATHEQFSEFPTAKLLPSFISSLSIIREKYNLINIYDQCPKEMRVWIDFISQKEKYIYFPFRLTDKGYKALEIFQYIHDQHPDTKVVYTDPNETIDYVLGDLAEEMATQLIKSPSDRCVHLYHLAFGNCIVPYFENPAIKHVCEDEMGILGTNLAYTLGHISEGLLLPKSRLIVLDGFDEIGKSLHRTQISKKYGYEDLFMNDVIQSSLFLTNDKTKFKDKEAQMKVISSAWGCALNSRAGHDDVVAERLWWSDNVYSEMFHREPQFNKLKQMIKNKWEVHQICLLWKSYSDFATRCRDLGREPEYDMREFLDIQDGFRKKKEDDDVIINVDVLDTKEEIYRKITEKIAKWFYIDL